jgi:excisionase family DNA binding protein
MESSANERHLREGTPVVLTTDEVVELLGLSAPTVRKLVRLGHLPARRPPGGRKLLFRREEVLAAVDNWAEPRPAAAQARPTLSVAISDDDHATAMRVTCAAPAGDRHDATWTERCRDAWCSAAVDAGLDPERSANDPELVLVNSTSLRIIEDPATILTVDDCGDERWETLGLLRAGPA